LASEFGEALYSPHGGAVSFFLEISARLTKIDVMEVPMAKYVSAGLVVFTGIVLVIVMATVATSRFDSCYEPPLSQWTPRVASTTNGPSPTPAPPRATVTLQVQADQSDIEISWAEN
jgi:hypothetical protein